MLHLELLGVVLSFAGSFMTALSVGNNPEDAHSTNEKGQPVYLASILRPKAFKCGLFLLAFGFVFQAVPKVFSLID